MRVFYYIPKYQIGTSSQELQLEFPLATTMVFQRWKFHPRRTRKRFLAPRFQHSNSHASKTLAYQLSISCPPPCPSTSNRSNGNFQCFLKFLAAVAISINSLVSLLSFGIRFVSRIKGTRESCKNAADVCQLPLAISRCSPIEMCYYAANIYANEYFHKDH